jgi:hypothetical protein
MWATSFVPFGPSPAPQWKPIEGIAEVEGRGAVWEAAEAAAIFLEGGKKEGKDERWIQKSETVAGTDSCSQKTQFNFSLKFIESYWQERWFTAL